MKRTQPREMGAPELERAGLAVVALPLVALKPDPENAREHNERNVLAIMESLSRFGQQKPLVVTRAHVVVAGHGTLEAAKRLGWKKLACHVTELEGANARAFAIADNRVAELSQFDEQALARQLATLDPELVNATGFDAGDLAEMSSLLEVPTGAATEAKPGTRLPRSSERAVTVAPTIAVKSSELFERALVATGHVNREDALVALCQHYLTQSKRGKNG